MPFISTIAANEAHAAEAPLSERDYRAAMAEFDALWGRPCSKANRCRMDYLISVIAAFEESRGKPSAS